MTHGWECVRCGARVGFEEVEELDITAGCDRCGGVIEEFWDTEYGEAP